MEKHKSGFINIMGKPNVGKSTLMNTLLGDKLSIVSSKAQTTRHRITGLANGDDYQMIFNDTPGILDPKYRLHERMMDFIDDALQDGDITLLVVEAGDKIKDSELESKYLKVIQSLEKLKTPVIVAINKCDLKNEVEIEELKTYWATQLPFAHIIPISAISGLGIHTLLHKLLDLLPFSPPYFDKEIMSDRPLRFFITEIIREKIFLNYKQEIPYCSEVGIEEYKEGEDMDRIRALIYVERESQKPIVIGKGGSSLKRVATDARKDMEEFLGKKVYLEIFVKVKDNWRQNERLLKGFGY